MISLLLFRQIAQLFVAMAMGWLLGKARSEDSRHLSVVALYLINPCVIITSYQLDFSGDMVRSMLLSFGAAVLIHLLMLVLTALLRRPLHLSPVEQASVIYSNCVNLLIPVVSAILGKEWLLFTSMYMMVQIALLWSHCRMLLSGERTISLRNIFGNLNVISMLIGLALFLLHIRLPGLLSGAMESVAGLEHPVFSFGLDHPADCTAVNLTNVDTAPAFDILIHGELYAHVNLHVFGHHNILNALAAASSAYVLGLPGKAVEEGLASFTGAGRRFEYKGEYNGAKVYDDYAHHPDELHALLTTARDMGYQRLVVAFQPHTYSRTAKLFDRFVEELKLADVAILAEIYAAREQNTLGISSADLCQKIPGAVYCSTLDKVTAQLKALAQPGDLILTVGAGDIYRAGEKLLQEG